MQLKEGDRIKPSAYGFGKANTWAYHHFGDNLEFTTIIKIKDKKWITISNKRNMNGESIFHLDNFLWDTWLIKGNNFRYNLLEEIKKVELT